MCSSISWEQFITALVVMIGLYYLYVGVSYYRKDLWCRLRTQKSPGLSARPVAAPAMPDASPTPNPLLPVVHDLVDEIRALLQAEGNAANKDDLLGKLQRLLQKYPTLKDTPFQPSISQLIYIESKNQCALDLDEDEVGGLWV
jgi:hypothetical protein